MHKYSLNLVPQSFQNLFCPLAEPNRTKKYVIERKKYKILEQFPPDFLPKIWNDISLLQKSILKHNTFKKDLKKSLIEKYPHTAWCSNPMCEDCHPNYLT